MRWPREFLRLVPANRRLVVRALILVWVFRVVARFAPFPWLWRLVSRPPQALAASTGDGYAAASRIGWAVSVAGSKGNASCIPQAMAACLLLRTARLPYRVRVGVLPPGGKRLRAHMWVESFGRVVSGEVDGLAEYVCLMDTGVVGTAL